MALKGTIQDFALPDIFQLIGIQRKTGVLTLKREADAVSIKFLDGCVVEADTTSDSLESRLGTVLVRTGRIEQRQLDEALQIQGKTLQRLGHILVKRGTISQDELVEALRIQSSQIIYRLFRWREGSYHFDPVRDLDYDQSHSTPMSSETILMEGARMVDEWPIIERRIPSDTIVLRKTPAAASLNLGEAPCAKDDAEAPGDEFEIDLAIEMDRQPTEETDARTVADDVTHETGIQLCEEERQVLALVDGKRTVREIIDLLTLAEFETFRALSEMLSRNLLERVENEAPTRAHGGAWRGVPRLLGWLAKAGIACAAIGSLATLPEIPFSPWRLVGASPPTERLRLYAATSRLEQIERALQVFYLDSGSFPRQLAPLVEYGYLDPAALHDPWGRSYTYQVSPGGYQLLGQDAAGARLPELTVARRFSEVQRLLMNDDTAPPP